MEFFKHNTTIDFAAQRKMGGAGFYFIVYLFHYVAHL